MLKYVLLIAIGLTSGVLGGMGMGGGTLLIPLLTVLCGVGFHEAQLYNLTAFVPMALISLFIHKKNGLIKGRGLLPVVIGAIVFSAAFAFVANAVDGDILKRIFGGFLIATAIFGLVFKRPRARKNREE